MRVIFLTSFAWSSCLGYNKKKRLELRDLLLVHVVVMLRMNMCILSCVVPNALPCCHTNVFRRIRARASWIHESSPIQNKTILYEEGFARCLHFPLGEGRVGFRAFERSYRYVDLSCLSLFSVPSVFLMGWVFWGGG